MPKVLLSVPHRSQQSDGDCLAACAAMVLAHLGRAIDYPLYINDPAHPEAPVIVPRGDFEPAWLERDTFYALITP